MKAKIIHEEAEGLVIDRTGVVEQHPAEEAGFDEQQVRDAAGPQTGRMPLEGRVTEADRDIIGPGLRRNPTDDLSAEALEKEGPTVEFLPLDQEQDPSRRAARRKELLDRQRCMATPGEVLGEKSPRVPRILPATKGRECLVDHAVCLSKTEESRPCDSSTHASIRR